MFLTFEARTPCVVCRYQMTHLIFQTVRVNKRSIRPAREEGPHLGWRDVKCSECGAARPDAEAREVFTMTADSAAQVRAYRLRRWPELAPEGAAS